jgi:hypothetical protein
MALLLAGVLSTHFVLLLVALVCFLLAAIGVPQQSRVNLVALGLFFWVLSILIGSYAR